MAIVRRTIWISVSKAGWFGFATRAIPPAFGTLSVNDEKSFLIDSPRFAATPLDELHSEIEVLLARLTTLAHLYQPGAAPRFNIWQIVDTDGAKHSATKQILFRVLEAPYEPMLAADHSGDNAARRLLQLADVNEDVSRALRLLRESDVSWPTVYDVIEFLEDRIPIGPEGWISKSELSRYRQTANYHRHMGKAGKLPDNNAPALHEAERLFIKFLRRWLCDNHVMPAKTPDADAQP